MKKYQGRKYYDNGSREIKQTTLNITSVQSQLFVIMNNQ